MTEQERKEKAQQLREENRGILATPLLSEGTISPMQVGLFSDRQKKHWQEKVQQRMALEATLRHLEQPDESLAREQAQREQQEREGRILQLNRRIEDINRFGMGKRGKLKPSWAQELATVEAELATFQ